MIDPLLQATYVGGGLQDAATAIVIDPTTGDVFVTGTTNSSDFPGTAGGAQPTSACCDSAFVARLDSTLKTIKQATYLGVVDGGFVGAFAIAVNPTTDEVFVAGETSSENLPGTTGGAQPFQGGNDAFVARFNTSLTVLKQATYFGGSDTDSARALAIDPMTNEAIVAGVTISPDFLGTSGGAQPAFGGGIPSMSDDGGDAFVVRLNGDLTNLNQATYLGGVATDTGSAVAVYQMTGEVFVGGTTSSRDFPGIAGGAQLELGGDETVSSRA